MLTTLWRPIRSGGKNPEIVPPTVIRIVLLIAVIIMGPMGWPDACRALTIDGNQQYRFAEQLFNTRQYRRAAEEYERFAFFFPDDSRHQSALFKAGQSLLLAKDPASAIERFKMFTDQDHLDDLVVASYFMLVECYLQLQTPSRAVVTLNNLITLSANDTQIRDRAYYRLGWLYIDETNWRDARRAFSKISPDRRSRYRIDQLEKDLDDASNISTRDPVLAGALSIIPGGGQLYCNRYEDALIAFAVNLGLFWAAHDAYDEDQYALGSLLAFAGIGFYAGNIYSAVGDAHKFNEVQKQSYRNALKRHIVVGAGPPDSGPSNGLLFSLQIPF